MTLSAIDQAALSHSIRGGTVLSIITEIKDDNFAQVLLTKIVYVTVKHVCHMF